jgi:hypothetical protein
MKRGVAVLALAFLLIIPLASGLRTWNFVLVPDCRICVEGAIVNASLRVANTGDEVLMLKGLTIKDASEIVFFESPMDSTAEVGETVTINFNMVVPPATRGSTLFYKPCLVLDDGGQCSNNYARMIIMPYESIECIADSDCESGRECLGYKCRVRAKGGWNAGLIAGAGLGVLAVAAATFTLMRRRKHY